MSRPNKLVIFAISLVLCFYSHAGAENVHQPASFTYSVLSVTAIDGRTMNAVNVSALAAEDMQRESDGLPPRFAKPIRVRLTPQNSGTWEQLDSRLSLWRLRVRSPGALSLNFGFTQYFMPSGGHLLIYPANFHAGSNSRLIRSFNESDNETHGQLWTPVVFGDDIIIEVVVPSPARNRLKLQLSFVNHDYKGFGRLRSIRATGSSGSCNVDVACPEAEPWQNQARSVGVISVGGSLFCSGSLLNNTAEDRKMYFLTAMHCGINSKKSASLVVYWNYQNSTCRTPGSAASGSDGDGTLAHFQTGSYLRAAAKGSDFTLVELDDAPVASFNVFWAGWDRSNGNFFSSAGIHHPNTAEKRISVSTSTTTTTSYYGTASPGDGTHIHVSWAPGKGVTEPGSSGSPLYSPQGRFIGQLHGGPSSCAASDKSDYYGRFSVSWNGNKANTRLKDWLDPANTGALAIDGISQ